MSFIIHGRDPRTGEKADPFFSNATTEELARAEASRQGMVVDLVERHEDRTPAATTSLSTLGAAAPAAQTAQYEFGPYHNKVIGGLVSTMSLLGVALMIFGILQVVATIDVPRAYMPAPLVPAVLAMMFGGLLLYAADAFRQIVRTQGHDVDYLMEALNRLRFTFALQLFVAVLAIVAAIVVQVSHRAP